MGCILQDLFTKVNILLPRQWGHPVDQAIYLLKFQEISNRTHWTDPSTWVSNISSDLLTGLLVRSHSIFDGQVWINIKQVHLASLLTFWKLKPGIPSYRGSIWFHLLKLAGMTNAASSWRTRLAAWLCGKYFGPRVKKKTQTYKASVWKLPANCFVCLLGLLPKESHPLWVACFWRLADSPVKARD